MLKSNLNEKKGKETAGLHHSWRSGTEPPGAYPSAQSTRSAVEISKSHILNLTTMELDPGYLHL